MAEKWTPKPSVRIDVERPNGVSQWVFKGDLPDGWEGFGQPLPPVIELKRERKRLLVTDRMMARIVWEWLSEEHPGIKVSADLVVSIGLSG